MTCECGCGAPTPVATKTDRSKGWEKGRPLRFLLGHNARVTNRPRRTGVGPDDWNVEDCGYATPCWIWRGKARASGSTNHRRVGIEGHYESAHAAVYRRLVGPVPEGCELHHLCERQDCVRPDHLQPLPKADHRRIHKSRLTDEQVAAIRSDRRLLREIAVDYGISTTHASDIRRGKERVAA